MARGKGPDLLSLDELIGEGKEGPLLDIVLEPGQVSRQCLLLLVSCAPIMSSHVLSSGIGVFNEVDIAAGLGSRWWTR